MLAGKSKRTGRGERMRLSLGLLALAALAAVTAGGAACGSGKKAGLEPATPTRLAITATSTPSAAGVATGTPTGVPSPTASATPVASTTPGAAELPGADGWRAFAALVSDAVAGKDADFFVQRALLDRHECTAGDVEAGLLPCTQAGEVLEGVYVGAWRSEWSLVPLDYLRETLARFLSSSMPGESDKFGDGAPLLYAIGEGAATGGPPVFLAFVTDIVQADGAPERVLDVLQFVFVDDRWRLRALMFGEGPALEELFDGGLPQRGAMRPLGALAAVGALKDSARSCAGNRRARTVRSRCSSPRSGARWYKGRVAAAAAHEARGQPQRGPQAGKRAGRQIHKPPRRTPPP